MAISSNLLYKEEEAGELISWLINAIENEVQLFSDAPEEYTCRLVEELPLSKRFGRLCRSDIWHATAKVDRFDTILGDKHLEKLTDFVQKYDDTAIIEEMTLTDYLRFCEICYDVVGYENLDPNASPLDKYKCMADGRHEGLLDLPPDDTDAFAEWLTHRPGGGHPFEICRGGNSTHISLHVVEKGEGFQLYLSGFSTSRVVETAKMASALFENTVPFVLAMKNEMLEMVTGEDFVGIVPDDLDLSYQHDQFPEKDRVYSFAHLWMIEELCSRLKEKIRWYPIETLSHCS